MAQELAMHRRAERSFLRGVKLITEGSKQWTVDGLPIANLRSATIVVEMANMPLADRKIGNW